MNIINTINTINQISKIYLGNGEFVDFTCTFNKPTTVSKISEFERKSNIIIPKDYKEFLLINDGIMFFNARDYEIFGIESIDLVLNTGLYKKGFYIVGNILGTYIAINSSEVNSGEYMYYSSNSSRCFTAFNHDFQTFLDRIISCQINKYWEWSEHKKILNFGIDD